MSRHCTSDTSPPDLNQDSFASRISSGVTNQESQERRQVLLAELRQNIHIVSEARLAERGAGPGASGRVSDSSPLQCGAEQIEGIRS